MALSDPALEHESPLKPTELGDAEALVREAGWNQLAADWRIFLELGTVYAVRTCAGRVVATAAMLPYGGRFAWISMVLVAGEYRRQGLATRLLRRCTQELTGAGLVPVLDATPAGRAVYVALGFEDAWGYHRLARGQASTSASAAAGPEGIHIRPIDDAAFAQMSRYDASVFGADRSAVLARLRGRAPGAELVAHRGDQVCGLLLGRHGRSATQLGPLVADNGQIARALLARGLATVAGPLYVDIKDDNAELRTWLEGLGFAAQRPLTRMLHGRTTAFGNAARTFAVAGPELG